MISGRISFVAGMVGLGLTGHRAEQHQQQKHHPLPLTGPANVDLDGTPMPTGRRYRLLSLLKGPTF